MALRAYPRMSVWIHHVLNGVKRGFLMAAVVVVGVGVSMYVLYAIAHQQLRETDRRERRELQSIFTEMIRERVIPDPPAPGSSFIVTSKHGNDPYTIWYTNALGERAGYFVSKHFSEREMWNFQQLGGARHVLRRERQANR